MDLQANKTDGKILPSSNRRISAEEWNQLAASCMAFITAAGLTPDAADNEQFLNAFKTIAADLELVGANTNLSNLTAAGQTKFDDKADIDLSNVTKPHITEDYVNGTSWYRIWSDGWCEQGGLNVVTGSGAITTISYLIPLQYVASIICTQQGYSASAQANNGISTYGTTSFDYQCGTVGNPSLFWIVRGPKA